MSLSLHLGIGAAAMSLVMLILLVVERVRRDASHVDVAWAAGIGALAVFYGVTSGAALERRVLLSANNLLALVDDVLDLSRVDAGRVDLVWSELTAADLLAPALATAERCTTLPERYEAAAGAERPAPREITRT